MQKYELDSLKAALVSWATTHIMNTLLSFLKAIATKIWEKTMEHVKMVNKAKLWLAVKTICSSVIVVGVYLEWLAHVARAVGAGVVLELYKRTPLRGIALTANHSAIFHVHVARYDITPL